MKIGVIGSGNIGANLGKLLSQAGHEVFYSYSRSEDKLRQLAAEAGDESRWGTPTEAVAFAEVVILAPPYRVLDEVLEAAGSMNGKIIIDAVNPFTDKGPVYADQGTAAEEIAAKLPGAKSVKAYNHIWYQHIAMRHHENPPLTAFISGDDAEAKTIVTKLVQDTGFHVWDLGTLATARWTEPHGALFNKPMTQAQAAAIVPTLPPIPRA